MNLAGSCNTVIDLGKDDNLQGVSLSDREQISHLSKNGRNRHKAALVFSGSLASKACRPTGRADLTVSQSLTIGPSVVGQMPGAKKKIQFLDPHCFSVSYQTAITFLMSEVFLFSFVPGISAPPAPCTSTVHLMCTGNALDALEAFLF